MTHFINSSLIIINAKDEINRKRARKRKKEMTEHNLVFTHSFYKCAQ